MTDILSLVDPDTGLLDRQGWQRFALGEEERCRRHGNEATVIVVRVADAGETAMAAAAAAVRAASRLHDLVGRISPNELAVLATECPPPEAAGLADRLSELLTAAGVPHFLGVAGRHMSRDMLAALDEAGARAAEAAEASATHA
jgi:GGDEF domain-containing protein